MKREDWLKTLKSRRRTKVERTLISQLTTNTAQKLQQEKETQEYIKRREEENNSLEGLRRRVEELENRCTHCPQHCNEDWDD